MNIFITIILIIAGIVALLFIIALFSKKGYVVAREINIRKSKREVFEYIKLLKNQDHYNKWVMMDPNMKKTFTGKDGMVGFIYAWNGNKKAGEGEQEIKAISENEKIDMEIRFVRPFKGISYSSIILTAVSDGGTHVTWSFSSELKYPTNMMLLFMNFDTLLGKDIDISLNTLKGILEK